MKCEKCQEKEAAFFCKQQINGVSKTYQLCADCAKEAGFLAADGLSAMPFSFLAGDYTGLLGDIFGAAPAMDAGTAQCPRCGATWREIANEGKVGCPGCYEAFAQRLAPGIRDIHGRATHTGHVPYQGKSPETGLETEEKKAPADPVAAMRAELHAAIAAEDYEKAAVLRDAIKAEETKREEA